METLVKRESISSSRPKFFAGEVCKHKFLVGGPKIIKKYR